MKTVTYIIVALTLAVSARPSPADEPSIVFAHSGQKVTISMAGNRTPPGGLVALSAYGRLWGEPATMENGNAQFVTPAVRAPTVFRLVPVRDASHVLGELVVYPKEWIPWDKDKRLPQVKDTQFVVVGAPAWFDTWLEAVGLSVEKLPRAQSLADQNWRTREKPSLLILGRKAAGDGPAAMAGLAALYQTNILVLEADWFGKPTTSDRIVVLPKHARAALADLKTQDWALPASFRGSAVPWPGILNRLSWIASDEYPLVEEIHTAQKGGEPQRIVLSYAPWCDQLGRCAMADELLLRLLTETAKGNREVQPWNGRWCLLYPAADRIKREQRPVQEAALKLAEAKYGEGTATSARTGPCDVRGYVLDLRGTATLPENLLYELDAQRTIEPRINERMPLLILGDAPLLDSWGWLKLDRHKQQSLRPGVIWWPDRSLPPSLAGELRLMELFTEWNIFLGKHPREGSNENRENEP